MIRTQPKAPVKRRAETDYRDVRLGPRDLTPDEVEDQRKQLDAILAEAKRQLDGGKRRGRPPSESSKRLITLRLDPDVIAKFRATGDGWMTRINEALKAVKL